MKDAIDTDMEIYRIYSGLMNEGLTLEAAKAEIERWVDENYQYILHEHEE